MRCSRIGDRHDEPDGPIVSFGNDFALHLAGPQLSLEVDQPTLNLNVDDLQRVFEEDVGRARIARPDRDLEPRCPARVGGVGDGHREHQLSRIAQ